MHLAFAAIEAEVGYSYKKKHSIFYTRFIILSVTKIKGRLPMKNDKFDEISIQQIPMEGSNHRVQI